MAADAKVRSRRWFFVAGVTGGLGLWISVAGQVPVLAGIALGGLIAAWVNRGDTQANPAGARVLLPWEAWALGGAATSLAVYLIEYFPAHLGSWQLRINHPLYGLAWLGGGAVLARVVALPISRWSFKAAPGAESRSSTRACSTARPCSAVRRATAWDFWRWTCPRSG